MKSETGLTLIELMIAVVIGIFISLMVVQYLVTSTRMFKRHSVDSNIEQNASFATSYLSRYIRQAGTRDGHGTEVPFFTGNCGNFSPCTSEADGADGTDAISDRVAVQMFVTNGGLDCAGNDANGQIANVFYIDQDTGSPGTNSLFCGGYDVAADQWLGNGGVALIDGIDHMQVVYGVVDENEQIYSYLSAAEVPAVGGSIKRGWDRVRAVKVALLVSDGYQTTSEISRTESYRLFDVAASKTDRIARRVFSTAITINSKIP